jgi:histidinol-phosphate aminotransferase
LAFLYRGLDDLAVEYLESQANFCLIRVAKNADEVFEDLLQQGVIVRSMTSYGYPDCIRVNVGRRHENVRLLEALKVVLK